MGLNAFLESKKGKLFLHKTYSFGASIVIVGALFKIQHYPGSAIILPLGLGTEALIFVFFALQKPHEEVDWSLVYPELSGMHGDEADDMTKEEKKGSITEQLDDMLEEAKIGPELMESLERGMRSLSETAAKMTNIADASVATNDYVNNISSAAKNIGDLSVNSGKAAESLEGMVGTDVGGATRDYINNVKSVTESMGELSTSSTKASELLQELSNSTSSHYVQQMEKMSENAAQLNQHLESLNTVYGNMLTAMSVRK
jgi:gliding motility-associated protein GldL